MSLAKEILELSLQSLKKEYPTYQFMVQRDIAWILQKKMIECIEEKGYALEVYQDYPLKRGCKEYNEHELVIVSQGMNYREMFRPSTQVELVVRILFEPSRHRRDICEYHLPRVLIPQFLSQVNELKSLVETNKAKETSLILVDEYSRHRHQIVQEEQMDWQSWGSYDDPGLNVSVLFV